jgi:GNAT superfamily N-acetyltransferase
MKVVSNSNSPALSHAEPVLAVKDIAATVNYWHEIIGFPEKWMYGNPPNHGGVSWQGAAFIQFGLNPKLAEVSEGHSVWIRAHDIAKLYAFHQERKASIVSPLENKPWGFSEYTLKDINGYSIHFSSPALQDIHSKEGMPSSIRIIARKPTPIEMQNLMNAVGWTSPQDESAEFQLMPAIHGVIAQDTLTNETIGCALIMGDRVSFYYIKNVIVHPDWQRKRVGTALMNAINQWIEANAPDQSTVGMFTGDHLASFYKQFGFIQACGMYKQIIRNPDSYRD